MKTIYKVLFVVAILNCIGVGLIIVDYQWFRTASLVWQFGEIFYIASIVILAIVPALLVGKLESIGKQKISAIVIFSLGSGLVWLSTFLILEFVNPNGLLKYLGERLWI